MELPDRYKNAYRHWHKHTGKESTEIPSPEIDAFVTKRTEAWKRKERGDTPPFTADPIIAAYRFCNILRELDRQTIEYHEMLAPLRKNFALWLMNMFYARMVARPSTLTATGLLSFSDNEAVLQRLLAIPSPRYGSAYVFPISTIMKSDTPTRELLLTTHVPRVMLSIAAEIETWRDMSVAEGVKRVTDLFGFKVTFLWTEVLIDVAYQYPERINLFRAFPVGPGALPTAKMLGRTPEALGALAVPSGLTYNGESIILSAENWEGIFCEFRKYTNLKRGVGRKRLFR